MSVVHVIELNCSYNIILDRNVILVIFLLKKISYQRDKFHKLFIPASSISYSSVFAGKFFGFKDQAFWKKILFAIMILFDFETGFYLVKCHCHIYFLKSTH